MSSAVQKYSYESEQGDRMTLVEIEVPFSHRKNIAWAIAGQASSTLLFQRISNLNVDRFHSALGPFSQTANEGAR